jgi:hypothetical protein
MERNGNDQGDDPGRGCIECDESLLRHGARLQNSWTNLVAPPDAFGLARTEVDGRGAVRFRFGRRASALPITRALRARRRKLIVPL